MALLRLLVAVALVAAADGFVAPLPRWRSLARAPASPLAPLATTATTATTAQPPPRGGSILKSTPIGYELEAELTDEKVEALFAWVSRAFAGDPKYK